MNAAREQPLPAPARGAARTAGGAPAPGGAHRTTAPLTPLRARRPRAGMDFYVILERPGFRVARRRKAQSKIGRPHKLTKDDAMKWFQQKFEGVILTKPSYKG